MSKKDDAKDAEVIDTTPPWRKPPEQSPVDIREKQLADDVMNNPQKPLKKIADDHGMTTYQAKQALAQDHIRDYVAVKMEEGDARVEKAIRVLSEAMDADKHELVSRMGPDSSFEKVPDHAIRTKAAELTLRIHGFIGNVSKDKGSGEATITDLVKAIRAERETRELPAK